MEEFGSIISEILSKNMPRKLTMFGTATFGKSGKAEDVLKYFELDSETLFKKISQDLRKQ